jgi:hypothetical protein
VLRLPDDCSSDYFGRARGEVFRQGTYIEPFGAGGVTGRAEFTAGDAAKKIDNHKVIRRPDTFEDLDDVEWLHVESGLFANFAPYGVSE